MAAKKYVFGIYVNLKVSFYLIFINLYNYLNIACVLCH